MSLPAKIPRTPILCYVTDRKSLPVAPGLHNPALTERIAAAIASGVDWIQIREKDLSGSELSQLVRESLALARQPPRGDHPTRIVVNDRVDVALAEQAGGTHLSENSLPIENVAHWIGSHAQRSGLQNFLVGVSCHSLDGAVQAERGRADYIFFGPVFATPSKTDFGAPQGLDRLREVCKTVSLPVLAIGGITRENASSCLEAGAAGLVAIRLFQDAADLSVLVKQLRAAHD